MDVDAATAGGDGSTRAGNHQRKHLPLNRFGLSPIFQRRYCRLFDIYTMILLKDLYTTRIYVCVYCLYGFEQRFKR